ncbi:MAG TPA: sigma 54-interacting transcriptional regulator [Opitutaceae bacterium]
MSAIVPDNEAERLEKLRGYRILDTPTEREFDELADAAARVCETPIALVSFLDADRQWFKARAGLETRETPRELSFCAYAILQDDLFTVPDAQSDERFAANALVTGEPRIRFYAGAPLIAPDGQKLGTLCVIDHLPRDLTPAQRETLRTLSRQVVAQLELRRTKFELGDTIAAAQTALRTSEEFKTRLIEGSQDCIKVLDLDGGLLSMNAGGMKALEICDLSLVLGSSWIDFWQDGDRELARAAVEAARKGGTGRFVGFFPTVQTRKPMWFDVLVTVILDPHGNPERLLAVSRDVTEKKQAEIRFRAIAEGTASATGDEFFQALVRHFASALQVRYAFIAQCGENHRARTRAFWKGDAYGEDFEYDVMDAPCRAVLEGRTVFHDRDLQRLYPRDTGLVALAAESYLGIPLRDSSGQVVGHLAALDDKPMDEATRAEWVVNVFAARAAAELERLKTEERERTLLEINNAIISNLTRENLFAAVSQSLRKVIPFHHFAIFLHDPTRNLLTLAAVETSMPSTRFNIGLEVAVDESHVGPAIQNQHCFLRPDLEREREYLIEQLLFADGLRSLVLVPLVAHGTRIGTLNVASTTTHQYSARDAAYLQEVAGQMAMAIENMRAYENLQRLSLELGTLVDVNRAIGRHLHRDELFGALADCLQRVLPTERFGIEMPIEGGKLQAHLLGPLGATAGRTRVEVLPAAGTACYWVEQNRRSCIVALRHDLRQRFPVTFRVMERENMQSLCALPLEIGGRCRGVLFFMAAEPGAYSRVRSAFLEQITRAVAVALDDCLAHEEVRRLRDRLAAENAYLQEEIRTEHNFDEIVGSSPALLQVLRDVDQVAATESTVLITGETGTGKELIARAIHDRSPRKNHPLVKVNCGAISAGLVESELFGHVKGAFTGALANRDGRFKLADGGTLFLDEVGELPPDTQVKFLRVLQEHEFEPIGSTQTIKVNVRIIAATNRDLSVALREGKFRGDLFYRLNVFPIHSPALREREGDVPLLVTFFLQKFAKQLGKPVKQVSEETMRRLTSYAWPGNIRELQNVIERAVILSRGHALTLAPDFGPAHMPAPVAAPVESADWNASASALETRWPEPESSGLDGRLEEVERLHIESVLTRTGWVIEGDRGAARILRL